MRSKTGGCSDRARGGVRRRSLVAAVGVGLLLSATACGGGGSPGSEKVELSYRIWDKNQQPAMQQIVDKFQAANPNIKVTIQLTPSAEFWTKMQADATAGSAPDVFWMNGPNAQFYASNKVLLPLSDELKSNGVDLANYPEALTRIYSYEGKQYGIPKDFDTIGLWYNKKLFDAAGVKYPDETWTWQNVADAARKLTNESKGIYGIAAPPFGQENYYNTIFQAGGYVVSPDGKASGYEQPAAVEGLRFWTELMKAKVSPSVKSMTDTFPAQMFQSGKLAMYYAGSWDAVAFAKDDNIKNDIDVAVLPQGQKRAVVIHGLANVAYAKTKHPKEAMKFIAFLGSKEAADIQANTGTVIPAFAGTQDTWVKSMPQYHLQAYLDELAYAVPYPTSKNTSAWQSKEAEILTPAWNGEKDIATAATELATMMNAALQKEQ
ncbi:sugar ABC transporter substrate-binding protein [Micromonospora sp. DR5-3]|uniref:ABC transporter substrate-binding protein n=1 Tax=unclassified Micromonospora TaxID=2617518 RepID=UPI0011DBFF60|nr:MULTISPECIES: sugar ABC transporter substrate-binding protein [unclassified Micromonospora]MCW3816018.1 sugar ABC transporter substrate-binding protein [Micromonospora sp. DR5-3]TYC20348.1 sugar ABC transporter substrate-binding protein [Micromonospora sp. MP36]